MTSRRNYLRVTFYAGFNRRVATTTQSHAVCFALIQRNLCSEVRGKLPAPGAGPPVGVAQLRY